MFFGILNSNAALFLWDQFFMIKWNNHYIEHATKAVLYLLRDRFMDATDYDQMRKVFLDEPCLLHTADVQTAFVHLALKNENPKYIPAMNQRFYPTKAFTAPSNQDTTQVSNRRKAYLESIGIKDISLTLALPAHLSIVMNRFVFFVFDWRVLIFVRMDHHDKNLIFDRLLSKFRSMEQVKKSVMYQQDLYLFFVCLSR